MTTTSERSNLATADKFLSSASSVYDQASQNLALVAAGHALLALSETLDVRLAEIADAVAGVQDQVAGLRTPAQPTCRRRWWQRPVAVLTIEAADLALIRQALSDAADWRQCGTEDGTVEAVVDSERLAHRYMALRERLGGAA